MTYSCLEYVVIKCEIVKTIVDGLKMAVEAQSEEKKINRYQASELALVCLATLRRLLKGCR